ncbi:MAG TPA: glycoside hydrolase family 3 N-terminal domain-containing protein [Sedimentisphaerales bacterium]|jgi:beta-glucosidase|nr:glycoside hydrolase family 3 N-terminal domain-containing protein [Sedimentisphaerales bacterium]HNU31889.1 glycoside hydrolase family 3 N-terminal domain-containing protein [Sedimentisphaerales bacterium]
MRQAFIGLVVSALAVSGCSSTKEKENGMKHSQIDGKVRKLVAQMTVEEKVGQMTQITLEQFAKSGQDGYLILDEAKLRDGIVNHHLGSILNCGGQARTVENWQEIITKIQDVTTKETRLGIPIIYGIDTIHGANYVLGATIFPQNIAMAATGNAPLMEKIGEISALETRAAGIPWNFAPVLDVARQPMWPRVFETFGEDPYIASTMGAAYIRGQQGDDISDPLKVAVCMKHYLGYSWPQSGRDRTPAYIPDRQLRQWFVPPFAAAVKAGAVTCMANSSEINGVPVHSSSFYLKDLLRDELGFRGFVVSDWADIENLYTREKVAKDRREAVKMAVLAGVDMSMVPYDYSFYDTLVQLVQDGEVPMKRIDEAVREILRVKYMLGLFEKPYPTKSLVASVGTAASQKVNLQAAREAMTLLKNDGDLLPLVKSRKVLVTGPTANKLSVLNSGWTFTWQGDKEELYPQDKNTVLEAIRGKVGEANVTYVDAVAFDKEIDIAKAVEAAAGVDVIVACIGEPAYCETPGNIDDLTMSEPQLNLVEALAKTGKPVVLVLVEGRPRVIRTIVDDAKAILMAYTPGVEGGQAVADVLFGDVNPSGKLPLTYPKFPGGFVWYDHKNSEVQGGNKYDPQWPFGFGLSYSKITYRALRVDQSELKPDGKLTATLEVTNDSDRPAKETVHLYLSDVVASVTPPVKVLKRFQKVDLPPKATQTVRFTLTWDDLSFIGRDNKPVVEPGEFRVQVGDMSVSFTAVEGKK